MTGKKVAKKTIKKKKAVVKKATSKAKPKTKKSSLTEISNPTNAHLELWKKSKAQLNQLMTNGLTPQESDLEGWMFRGLNVGFGAKLLGIQKFVKCFYVKDYGYGKLMTGYNFIIKQNKIEDDIILKMSNNIPKLQGFYQVESNNAKWQEYKQAAMLNYGRGDNKWQDPAKLLRDYLVQPYVENNNLFLGKAYFAIGPIKIFGGFFVLERFKKLPDGYKY